MKRRMKEGVRCLITAMAVPLAGLGFGQGTEPGGLNPDGPNRFELSDEKLVAPEIRGESPVGSGEFFRQIWKALEPVETEASRSSARLENQFVVDQTRKQLEGMVEVAIGHSRSSPNVPAGTFRLQLLQSAVRAFGCPRDGTYPSYSTECLSGYVKSVEAHIPQEFHPRKVAAREANEQLTAAVKEWVAAGSRVTPQALDLHAAIHQGTQQLEACLSDAPLRSYPARDCIQQAIAGLRTSADKGKQLSLADPATFGNPMDHVTISNAISRFHCVEYTAYQNIWVWTTHRYPSYNPGCVQGYLNSVRAAIPSSIQNQLVAQGGGN